MKKLTTADAARFLLERDSFLILTHRRPDGDTLGSAAALCHGLRQLGKTAYVLENPEITPKYRFLMEDLEKAVPAESDTLIAVDVASVNMLPQSFFALADKIALRIDHHGTSESFTEQELVEPAAAACGQIIYDLLTEMGVSLDVPMANALYTATGAYTLTFLLGAVTAALSIVTYAAIHRLNQKQKAA